MVFFIKLSLYRRPEIVLKISYKKIIYRSGIIIKFIQNKLKIFYISRLVYNIFLLILVRSTELLPNNIYKVLDLTQVFLKKDLKFVPSD